MTVHVFFNDPAPTEIYTLSLHDALPIYDLVQRLNYNVINSKDVMPQLVTEHAVGCVTIPMLLTYSTKAYAPGKAPMSWPDFWDAKKFPGPRGYYNAPTYSLEFALIADGVPKDK